MHLWLKDTGRIQGWSSDVDTELQGWDVSVSRARRCFPSISLMSLRCVLLSGRLAGVQSCRTRRRSQDPRGCDKRTSVETGFSQTEVLLIWGDSVLWVYYVYYYQLFYSHTDVFRVDFMFPGPDIWCCVHPELGEDCCGVLLSIKD